VFATSARGTGIQIQTQGREKFAESQLRSLGHPGTGVFEAVAPFDYSEPFVVQGTFSLTPYLGYGFLWIVARSQVIDKTPNIAVKDDPNDISMNFVFPDQDNIERQRIFGGFKAKYYVFAFTFEIDYALAGDSVDDVTGITTPCDTAPASEKNRCDATDQSGAQATYSFAVSLDF